MSERSVFKLFYQNVQCVQSSLSQNGGADLRAHCSVKFPMTLKMGLERSRYSPKYSKLCYDYFGGWLEASNHPHLFTGRLPPGY